MADATNQALGHNPLCGDQVNVFLKLDGDVIRDVSFQGSGCAISTASASIMTETLKGKTVAEAQSIFEKFHSMVTGESVDSASGPDLGKLEVFAGVSKYPVRVKCASLAWHTLDAAIKQDNTPVSTE